MQRELAEMERARLADEAKKKAAEAAGDDDGSDGEKEPTPKEQPVEEIDDSPIEVDLAADSDDDFAPIEIKEKVKAHVREHGLAVRIPEDIINEAVRWRLERNDCQNRGYVLDGHPKNMAQADAVFMHTPEPPKKEVKVDDEGNPIEDAGGDEEVEKPDLTPKLHKHIYPESVISLKASEQ